MNEKIQAILLKIVVELKKLKWVATPDWEVTLKGEGHVPLTKQIVVEGAMGDDEWRDQIETHIDLKLASEDQITYFPEYTIYATVLIEGGVTHDIAYKMDADIAFTEGDFRDKPKLQLAAKKINRLVEGHIQQEFNDYIDQNEASIKAHVEGGWRADDHPER
jgi:hypothetical protein